MSAPISMVSRLLRKKLVAAQLQLDRATAALDRVSPEERAQLMSIWAPKLREAADALLAAADRVKARVALK